jgi:hypothetical protein
VLRQEDVRRSRGAQDGVDEAGGGPTWPLAAGGAAFVAPFGATASTPGLEGGGGARGAAARALKE